MYRIKSGSNATAVITTTASTTTSAIVFVCMSDPPLEDSHTGSDRIYQESLRRENAGEQLCLVSTRAWLHFSDQKQTATENDDKAQEPTKE
jgi:hypothetical protein